MTLFFAFVIGVFAGLRSLTPPAATAWAAHVGWLKLQRPLSLIGATTSVAIFTVLALAELVADKLPGAPNRTALPGLIARVLMGGLTGACIAASGDQRAVFGALLGSAGGLLGCFGGFYTRIRLAKALGNRDIYAALFEDLIAIAGSLLLLSRS